MLLNRVRGALFGLTCQLAARLPPSLRDRTVLWAWGAFQIRLVAYCSPKLVNFSDKSVEIKFPLTLKTSSGWDSMFMGALATGFDLTGGWLAFQRAHENKVGVLFKDCKIEFLRRADGDVHFVCNDGEKINEGILKAASTGERVNVPVSVQAYVPKKSTTDPVATSVLTLSMKRIK